MTTRRKVRPTQAPSAPPPVDARIAPIIDAFAKLRGVVIEPGWRARNLVLKLQGKMFVLADGEAFVAKLPRPRVDELVAAGAGTRFDPRKNGQLMKEWLVVRRAADWLALAHEAHAFAKRSARKPARKP